MTPDTPQKLPQFVDDRHYLFRPELGDGAPAGERDPLLATVRRSWSHDATLSKIDGEIRSNSLRVQVIISGHCKLKHAWRTGFDVEKAFSVLDEPAEYDVVDDLIKFGSLDIQTRNKYLKRKGLGTLMFNAMIAWAYQYHSSAMLKELLVTDHGPGGPGPFYETFGFRMTGAGTKAMPVTDLRFGKVGPRLERIMRGRVQDWMLPPLSFV